MSGTDASSRFRKRPSESSFETGSTCERPGEVADDRAHRAPAARPGGRKLRGESVPRTSRAHSRAISSTSWWRRKKPASPSSSMSASSLSSRASGSLRARG
jgi:hypothetical protein